MSRLLVKGAETALTAGASNATNCGTATVVRILNVSGSTVVVTVRDSTGQIIGSFSIENDPIICPVLSLTVTTTVEPETFKILTTVAVPQFVALLAPAVNAVSAPLTNSLLIFLRFLFGFYFSFKFCFWFLWFLTK